MPENEGKPVEVKERSEDAFRRCETPQVRAKRARVPALEARTQTLQTALLENLRLGMLVQDGALCVLTNTEFCQMFGFASPDLVIGCTVSEAFDPVQWLFCDPEAFMHGMRDLPAAGETSGGQELELVDGRTFERDYIPIQTGDRREHLWLYRDITQRKRAERILRQSEERFRLAAKCASDLIYEWDLSTGHMRWFGDIDGRLGYPVGQFPRTREAWEQAIHPEDLTRVRTRVERHLDRREPYREEYRVLHLDGTVLYWADSGTAVWDEHERAYKWIGVHTDITERKAAEEEARQARAELETRVEARTLELSRSLQLLRQENAERRRAEQEREQLIAELQDALARIKTLRGLIPICASCKKIRTDKGFWQQIEEYIGDHSEAEFSHGICPECARKLYPAYYPGDD